jgi:hypothetical protein
VLDGRLTYLDDQAGRALPEVFAPVIFAEDTQGLGDRFIETLGADLNRMLDAAQVGAGNSAKRTAIRATLLCWVMRSRPRAAPSGLDNVACHLAGGKLRRAGSILWAGVEKQFEVIVLRDRPINVRGPLGRQKRSIPRSLQ